MKKFYSLFVSFILCGVSATFAQKYAAEIIFINGGTFGVPNSTSIVSLNLDTQETTIIDNPGTASVQALTINGSKAYVAADDSLIMYDLETKKRIAAVNHKLDYPSVDGLAKSISVFGDKLFFSKQFPATSQYVDIIDANTLEYSNSVLNIAAEAAASITIGDSIYVAAPGGWAATETKIDVINLTDTTVTRTINFGAGSASMANICEHNGKIYGLVPRVYGGSEGCIIEYNPLTNDTIKISVPYLGDDEGLYSSASNYFGKIDDRIYFKNNGQIAIYNISEKTVTDLVTGLVGLQACVVDQNSGKLAATFGSWNTPSSGVVYSAEGDSLYTFYNVDASPEQMAVYYKNKTTSIENAEVKIAIYPNPCTNVVTIKTTEIVKDIYILNTQGQIVKQSNSVEIQVSDLTSGIYFIKTEIDGKMYINPFVKK